MTSPPPSRTVPWLEPGQPFPPVEMAWGEEDPAPGLLAAGGVLDPSTLVAAYSAGIFPWFSTGQPVLWWSTDPRMVLDPTHFRLHRSLRKTIQALLATHGLQIRMDHAFDRVIRACAMSPRPGQSGTWILPPMIQAYEELHAAGLAHSVETWIDNELVGGLYCVNIGAMVYGESMFSRRTDASKIALAGLVAFARWHALPMIDCQQETRHLASLGAQPVARRDFCQKLLPAIEQPSPAWKFESLYWDEVLLTASARA